MIRRSSPGRPAYLHHPTPFNEREHHREPHSLRPPPRHLIDIIYQDMPAVAEMLKRAYPALLEWAVGSIPANSDAQDVPSFRRWRFEIACSAVDLDSPSHC